jgi:hypothetical protein
MPTKGAGTPVPLRPVRRPDFNLYGIDGTLQQQALPADVGDLWKAFANLPDDVRRRFLQAANPYRRGLSLQRDDRTLGAALMVVACEALKLPGAAYDGHNIFGVVKALLGEPCEQALLDMVPHPLAVRNPHLHRGEFKGDEFTKLAFMSSYQDPSFDQACRVLALVTPAAIVEWLRRGGNYALPPRRRGNATGWGWALLCAALLAAGLILGWGLRALAG